MTNSERAIAWNKNNIERRREIARNWSKRNRSKVSDYQRRWRHEVNPEQAKFLNRYNSHTRRARLRKVKGSYTQQEWIKLLESFNNRCASCNVEDKPTRWGKLTIDHIIPISKGGSNSIDNIQPLCYHCNYTKYTKIINYRSRYVSSTS